MNKQNGITMIALIITIIVIAIISGISIAMISGDNGLINQANTASDETKKNEYKEILEQIGKDLRLKKSLDSFDTKTYMDKYETEIKNNKKFKEVKSVQRISYEYIKITTKENYVFSVKEDGVKSET